MNYIYLVCIHVGFPGLGELRHFSRTRLCLFLSKNRFKIVFEGVINKIICLKRMFSDWLNHKEKPWVTQG